MPRWLIAVPVWGDLYVEQFCAVALPALQRAISALAAAHDADARLVIHTDQPARVRGATDATIDFRPVQAGASVFDCMSQAHREVLALGARGDVVVLLTAGAVVSERALAYCADRFAERSARLRAVMCAVPRTQQENPPPDTSDAGRMMSWAWTHRHPMTRECTWPEGRSTDLSRTYFATADDRAVVTRMCLPHPLAVRCDGRSIQFAPTVDVNLMHCFDPATELHMATDCCELAVVKLTPRHKEFQVSPRAMRQRVGAGEVRVPDAHQRWSMSSRVVLVGDGTVACGDEEFMASVGGGK